MIEVRGKTNSVTTSGGGTSENTLKNLLDATKNSTYLFSYYKGTSVDDLINYNDTENVTNMSSMFMECNYLKSIPLLNTGKVTSMYNMINSCYQITTIPLFDTRNVKNMDYMLGGCNKLTEIPALDVSNVTNFGSMLTGCGSLTAIHMTGMKVSLWMASSTKFTTESLHEIIDNLATVTSTQKLTMGSTNLAKVSEEYVTIATNKGWTLA